MCAAIPVAALLLAVLAMGTLLRIRRPASPNATLLAAMLENEPPPAIDTARGREHRSNEVLPSVEAIPSG